jgi:hypothetical protein
VRSVDVQHDHALDAEDFANGTCIVQRSGRALTIIPVSERQGALTMDHRIERRIKHHATFAGSQLDRMDAARHISHAFELHARSP